MRKIKLVVQSGGDLVRLGSIGELIAFCSARKGNIADVLWWRDEQSESDDNVYGFRDFTQKGLLEALESRGEIALQFGPPDKSNTGSIFFVWTENGYAKMQADVDEDMRELAQSEADRTGKPATVRNLAGCRVSAKPSQVK